MEGRGSATISEVSLQTKHLKPEEESAQRKSKQEDLQKELDRLLQRQSALQTKRHRLQKQRTVLDGFADNVIKGPIKTEVGSNSLRELVVIFGCWVCISWFSKPITVCLSSKNVRSWSRVLVIV